jgi:hypothetical protein
VKSDTVKILITYVTAAVIALASLFGGVWVWLQPPVEGRDIALLYGFLGTSFGAASTFLFLGEARAQQAAATERAVNITPGGNDNA